MVSKKTRFEVLKRDAFKCRYCGACSPDVLLHVDHIIPQSEGGGDDLENLASSCEFCNLGKGATLLTDHTAVDESAAEMRGLADRAEQLEMLAEWRVLLGQVIDAEVKAFNRSLVSCSSRALSEEGRLSVKKWLKRFSLRELLAALDEATGIYRDDPDKMLAMVPYFADTRRQPDTEIQREASYLRAILRNRFTEVGTSEVPDEALSLILSMRRNGFSQERLRRCAQQAYSWSDFLVRVSDL